MAKKTFTAPIVNELKGSGWFQHPKQATVAKEPEGITPSRLVATEHKKEESQKQEHVQAVHKTEKVARTKRATELNGRMTAKITRTKSSSVQDPNNRRTVRRAHDFYETQLSALRRIRATRELVADQRVTMSSIVREAIDLLIAKEGLD